MQNDDGVRDSNPVESLIVRLSPRRATYTPPLRSSLLPPVRVSLADDELATLVADPSAREGGTLGLIERFEYQLRLREQEARSFSEWEDRMRSLGTDDAISEVHSVRSRFTGVLPVIPVAVPTPISVPEPVVAAAWPSWASGKTPVEDPVDAQHDVPMPPSRDDQTRGADAMPAETAETAEIVIADVVEIVIAEVVDHESAEEVSDLSESAVADFVFGTDGSGSRTAVSSEPANSFDDVLNG
jgi:hypothetical protein